MKCFLIIVALALVAVATCQQDEGVGVGGKLTPDQVVEKLEGIYGQGVCINLGCRQSCWAGGHKSGYCLNNVCTCVV